MRFALWPPTVNPTPDLEPKQGFFFQGRGQDEIRANPFTQSVYGNNAFNPQRIGSKPMVSSFLFFSVEQNFHVNYVNPQKNHGRTHGFRDAALVIPSFLPSTRALPPTCHPTPILIPCALLSNRRTSRKRMSLRARSRSREREADRKAAKIRRCASAD